MFPKLSKHHDSCMANRADKKRALVLWYERETYSFLSEPCANFLFSYLKYRSVFLWLAQETPTQQKGSHLYSKMMKAVTPKSHQNSKKSSEEHRRVSSLDLPRTLEIATIKNEILNRNKLNWQHHFKSCFIRPRWKSFSHWTCIFIKPWRVRWLVGHWRSQAGAGWVPSLQPALCTGGSQHPAVPSSRRPGWHPAPCSDLFLWGPSPVHDFAERQQSKQKSYLHFLQDSSLKDKGAKSTGSFSRNSILSPKTFPRNYYILDWTSLGLWKQGTS